MHLHSANITKHDPDLKGKLMRHKAGSRRQRTEPTSHSPMCAQNWHAGNNTEHGDTATNKNWLLLGLTLRLLVMVDSHSCMA